MKSLRFLYILAILLFAFSVCLTMYNLALNTTGEEVRVFGYPREYFILPLLSLNGLIIASNYSIIKPVGISRIVLLWMFIVPILSSLSIPKLQYFIEMLVWPTSYLASYVLIKNNNKNFKYISYTFLVVFIMGLFYFQQSKIDQLSLNSHGFENSANSIFCVLSVVPFILLLESKRLKYSLLFITILAVSFSNKRSAIIILGVSLIPTLWSMFSSKYSKMKKLLIVSVLLCGCLSLFFYVEDNYLENRALERFSMLDEDGGSGRSMIWAYVIDNYFKGDFISILLGSGHNAVSYIGWASASHNDFLDVLYDYGIFSFIIYLCLHLAILKRLYYMYKIQSPYFQSYFFMTVVFVIMSWISILIVQQRYLVYIAIYWGMIEAQFENKKNLNKYEYKK